ncbi:MAG: DegV family protein [Oscillospiraceae bacterium]|nr:DegV family protein [Oscillospiraceae bacterium]
MAIRFVVDSTANMPTEVAERFAVVPLVVRFGEEEFVEGVTIDCKRFYEKLVECDELPTTSQPTPEAFAGVYRHAVEAGDEVVVITVSSKLSGTYQSACIAAMDFPEGRIHVVDSLSVSIGAGILAQLAVQLADRGLTAAGIARELNREREKLRVIALLDTLEYLKKGGRISKTVAFAGGLLSIKPVVCVEEGAVKLLGKARGSRQGNNLLIEQIRLSGGVDYEKPLLLGYTGLSDVLLQKYIADSAALWEPYPKALQTCIIGSVIGTHVGPGAVAAAFFAKA